MKGLVRRGAWLAAAVLGIVAPAARADETDKRGEIAAFAGVQAGGTFEALDFDVERDLDVGSGFSWGLAGGFRLGNDHLLEFHYSRASSELVATGGLFGEAEELFDLTVTQIHGGINWEIQGGSTRPFMSFAIGATGFSPEPDDFASEWFFSGAVGGGVKLLLSDSVGIRLEARYIPVLISSEDEIFCRFGACFIAFDQDYTSQFDATAGVLFRF